jgi:multiple antibiotic resistance protein
LFDSNELIKTFVILFTIMDPIGNIPMYLSLSAGKTKEELHKLRLKTCLAVVSLLVGFFLCGKYILVFFGVEMVAFKLIGGLFLVYVAACMLSNNRFPPKQDLDIKSGDDGSIMPLAFPLLAGPAAISLVIIQADLIVAWGAKAVVILGLILVGIMIGVIFKVSDNIINFLGRTGIKIMTQLMGLILGSLAIALIAKELKVLLPGLS